MGPALFFFVMFVDGGGGGGFGGDFDFPNHDRVYAVRKGELVVSLHHGLRQQREPV